MASWKNLETDAAEIGGAGRRCLVGDDGVAIAFLATVSTTGVPRISPVCPIFCGDELYIITSASTPKVADLGARPVFALHAFLGANDEEFQLRGSVSPVNDDGERQAVHEAVPFQAFDLADPIFRFSISQALWAYWEKVGQPDTRQIKKTWRNKDSR